jgi:hypothetical protein
MLRYKSARAGARIVVAVNDRKKQMSRDLQSVEKRGSTRIAQAIPIRSYEDAHATIFLDAQDF